MGDVSKSPTDRSSITAGRVAVAGIAIFFLLVVLFVPWRVNLNNRINARIAAIRSSGQPTSPVEVNAWVPEVADSENGALALVSAFSNLHEFRGSTSVWFDDLLSTNWNAQQREFARGYVQTNAAALAQIEEALRYEKFRYPVDYSSGPGAKIPHLKQIKTAAQLFRIRTTLEIEEGSAAWTNSVFLQLKLAETLNSEPGIIGYLVRVAVVRIATTSAQLALKTRTPDAAGCRMLRDAFLETTRTNTLPQALIGERALWVPYFRMSRADLESAGPLDDEENPRAAIGKTFFPFAAVGFFESDLNFYLSTMEKGIEASRLSPPASFQLTNPLKGALMDASAKLAATAFAIEEFRQANNRLPETLQELTPKFMEAIPIDPFDGKPIRYRQVSAGYVVYSVDVDGRDDGGKTSPARKKLKDPNTYDLTFTVER